MQKDSQPHEMLPSDVSAFCALIARIVYRCLKERDARFLASLKEASSDVPLDSLNTIKENAHKQTVA